MQSKYYTLLVRFDRRGPWRPEFGDDCKPTVEGEAEFHRYSGHSTRIIVTDQSHGQYAITAAVRRLNVGLV